MVLDFGARLRSLVEGVGWAVEGSVDTPWCSTGPPAGPALPPQGWKLHLAASSHTAVTVLERAVPVLVTAGAHFKVASTLRMLVTLNQGMAGASQIGKFMTVYPSDDETAVELARALDEVLGDLAGPVVPSDRALREGGVVRYRYGGFEARWMQQASGEISPALTTPDGRLVPDTRLGRDAVPDWLDDPFEQAGLVQPPSEPPVLLAGRFRPVTTIYRSPQSAIFLAVDLDGLQRCVLKRALIDGDPWGAAERLVHEHDMLQAARDVPAVVNAIGWFDDGNERLLALEDIPGRSPLAEAADHIDRGYSLPPQRVANVGRALSAVVAGLHENGIVHRDVKPTNMIEQPDGTLRVIDLEIAGFAHDEHARGYGSIGYVGPEQQRGEPPEPADDVYAIGATMFSLAIGADISARPVGSPYDVRALCLDAPAELAAVIDRCLAPTREARYRDAGELERALIAISPVEPAPVPPYGELATVPGDVRERAREYARRMTEALCADLVDTAPTGRTWRSHHPAAPGIPTRDLSTGASGTLLALLALAPALRSPTVRDAVAEAAAWIDAAPRPDGDPLGGLYVGEGGVAVALLRAGQFLCDDALIESARRRSEAVAGLPHRSPDLFNGSAGRARAHLWIAEALGDDEAMEAAIAAAHHLADIRDVPAAGQATWTVLPEFGGGQQLGYAHGAAGIADVILDVAEATGDDRLFDIARGAGAWLVEQAVEMPGGAVAFPSEAGGRPWASLWCHGATGIGRFLLHLDRAGGLAAGDHWVLRATGVAAARLGRTLGPVVCHGLAGSIDHLLDLHDAQPEERHLSEAWSLAQLLTTFHVEGSDGHLRALSDHPGVTTPDLTVGYAGIAAVWLRLAEPGTSTLLAGRS